MSLRADLGLTRGDLRLSVAFSADAGEVLALVGPNGAGKSTVLAALAGLVGLDRGEIVLDGRVLERPSEKIRLPPQARDVGMMFQGFALFPHMSALDNVAYGPIARGEDRETAHVRARSLLRRFDVEPCAARCPSTLSGGQAQRVALARALAVEPALLLLDEPLSALDAHARGPSRTLLNDALGEFEGIKIVITHDIEDARAMADRMVVIEEGRVVQQGTTEAVFARPATKHLEAMIAGTNASPEESE
jgi:molybdate transport system ATP-binding protein